MAENLNDAPRAIPQRAFSESRFLSDQALWDFIVATQQDQPASVQFQETPLQCPAPHRLALNAARYLTDDELGHVKGCELCQNTISLGWRTECPSVESIVGFLAGSEAFAFHEAMLMHLDRDTCPRCTRLVDLPALRLMASTLRAYRRLLPVVVGRVAGAARSLAAGAITASGLGLPESWIELSAQWLSPQTVTLGDESTTAESAPFVVLENGPQGVLFEVTRAGELRAYFSGIGQDQEPPACALISEVMNADGEEDVSLGVPQWSAPEGVWECHWKTTPERFRVVLVERPPAA